MRILFSAFVGLGHVHPLIPLALAARDAGHEVRFATGPDLVGWVERCGLDARPVGLGDDEVHEIAERDHAGPQRANRMFTDVWAPAALPDLVELAGSWPPDVVVHEEAEYAGVLLAAMLAVPCVTQSWSAPARRRSSREAVSASLAPLWDRYLPERQHLTPPPSRRVGASYLDACPAQFQTDDLADIARITAVVGVRPGLSDGPPAAAPGWLAELPRPAAYVTLGTVSVFSTPAALAAVASALAPEFASVVVTSGPNTVASLGPLPPQVRVVDYLPQSLVLPSVDLVVSHGGAGGAVAALAHGVAHLVLPARGESQLAIAAAVERTGVGLSLAEGSRDRRSIAEAARRLVGEPAFTAAAQLARESLVRRPGPAEVLRLIESSVA